MTELIKKLLGKRVVGRLKTLRNRYRARRAQKRAHQDLAENYVYDQARFEKFSTTLPNPFSQQNLAAHIMMDCHRVEKGLALPAPRPHFGQDVLQRLSINVPIYEGRHGPSLETEAARHALAEYVRFHQDLGETPSDLATSLAQTSSEPIAGTMQPRTCPAWDFNAFARSRHSVRNFTGAPVEMTCLKKAIATAQTAPSVCNRQSGRVYIALEPEARQGILALQNGNAGFGEGAGAVLIIASDLRTFQNAGERNQCWVDGGLFAMMLSLALHGLGLGTCMLNWSRTADFDRKLRTFAQIPDHDAVITLMAVGHTPENYRVARSPRLPVDAVVHEVHVK